MRTEFTYTKKKDGYNTYDTEDSVKLNYWLERLKRNFSVGTEACFWNEALRWAKQGAEFPAVYWPSAGEAERIAKIIKPEILNRCGAILHLPSRRSCKTRGFGYEIARLA
jgi:hypothetical protein